MKRRIKKIILVVCVLIAIFSSVKILSDRVFCYDSNIAHPHIAQLAVELYNKNYDPDLTKEDIDCILSGVIEEDTPTRWLNHFYDPIHNKGLKGVYSSAKSWAEDPGKQASYALGDQSWQRALSDYADGDKKRAFIELGHVLHLIADMSVPAHTRDDVHVSPGDSYEQFLKKNWDTATKGVVEKAKVQNISSLGSAFDGLANYSNNNFYSDDTVEENDYKILDVKSYMPLKLADGKSISIVLTTDVAGNQVLAYATEATLDWFKAKMTQESLGLNYPIILKNHTQLLVPQAVGYSAGVIKLFLDEGQKAVAQKNLPMFRQNLAGLANLAVGKVVQGAQSLAERFQGRSGGGDGSASASESPVIMTHDADNTTQISNSPNLPNSPNKISKSELPISNQYPISNIQYSNSEGNLDDEPVNHLTPDPPLSQGEEEIVEPTTFVVTPPVTPPTTPPVTPPAPAAPTSQGGGGGSNTTHDSDNTTQTTTPTTTFVVTPTTTPTSTPETETPTTTYNFTTSTTSTTDIETPTSTPTSTEPVVPPDTTPPPVPSVTAIQIDFATSTIAVSWNSVDAILYDIQKKIGVGEWVDIATSTSSTTINIFASRLDILSFRARAYDAAGNVSDWSVGAEVTADWPKTVVINEVAWMGTQPGKSAANDEWLELYNNTDSEISLAGWKLFVTGVTTTWNNTTSTIPAHGYYLLERTSDNTILDITADAIYNLSGGLKNSGEKMVLTDSQGNTIDEVNCSNGWYAGTAGPQYRTMARVSATQPGSVASNWQTTQSIAPRGRPSGGSTLYGSPKNQNTGYWLLQGDISVMYANLVQNNSLTLTKANSPYAIDYSTFVPVGFTLNIDPGVVLYGVDKSSYINVKGTLNAVGTVDQPIIFTSALDTNYVSRNFSTLLGVAQSGDWSRVEIEQGGVVNASNAKFLYGGATFKKGTTWVYGTKWISQVLRNTGGSLILDSSEVKNSFVDSVEANRIYNASVWTESPNGYDSTTTINNTVFDTGWTALNFYGQENGRKLIASIQNSNFQNYQNPEGVIISNRVSPNLTNNTYANNTNDFVDLGIIAIDSDQTFTSGSKYGFSNLTVNSGKTLTIEPGVDFKTSGDIIINGSIQANGVVGNPINIMPKADSWGILLISNSTSSLSNVNLTKGNGGSLRPLMDSGMITAENSNLNLDNVVMMDSQRPFQAVYLKDSQTVMKDSIISWTTDYSGIQIIDGIKFSGGALHLNNTSFNNMNRGIEIYNAGIITVENMTLGNFINISDLNWWPVDALVL